MLAFRPQAIRRIPAPASVSERRAGGSLCGQANEGSDGGLFRKRDSWDRTHPGLGFATATLRTTRYARGRREGTADDVVSSRRIEAAFLDRDRWAYFTGSVVDHSSDLASFS